MYSLYYISGVSADDSPMHRIKRAALVIDISFQNKYLVTYKWLEFQIVTLLIFK